jgi:hypothetical protein
MIDQQAAAEPPGPKRLLHTPALGKQNKPLGGVRALDDLVDDA